MGNKLKSGQARYRSVARIVKLATFRLHKVKANTHNDFCIEFEPEDDIYFNFPVLIQSNGIPWEIGNLYLLLRVKLEINHNEQTFYSIANQLLDYLRFLEDYNFDYLSFSKNKRLSVIARYHRLLVEQIEEGKISRNTASRRINTIINFYRLLIEEKVISEQHIKSAPFTDVYKYIMVDNDFGVKRQLKIRSHEYAIKIPKKAVNSEFIQDGGELRPLTVSEQEQLLLALKESAREYQLIFYFALFTGARLQTVCTLRIKHIDNEPDSMGFVKIFVGAGTGIDTKYRKNMTLLVPEWLIHDILIYTNSDRAKARREKSFYGDTEENYIFLTKMGTPFYTSKSEILDRKKLIMSNKLLDNSFFRTYDGGAIRSYIKMTLLPRIKLNNKKFQSFKFHDLRATFAMNLLEKQLNTLPENHSKTEAIGYVQMRMGHKNNITTLQYLNYKSGLKWKNSVQDKVEQKLMKLIISHSDQYGDINYED